MKFPYGIADFYALITEDYFYADRTDRITSLEAAGKHLLFLRPRRFGKSLVLSMLENYYDLAVRSRVIIYQGGAILCCRQERSYSCLRERERKEPAR